MRWSRLAIGLLCWATLFPAEASSYRFGTLPALDPSSGAQQIAVHTPQGSTFWLVVSSRPTYEEAASVARSFAETLGPTLIMQSRNGVFAVVAGTLRENKAKANLSSLKKLRLIPADAFLSRGANFEQIVSHSYTTEASIDLMSQPAYLSSVRRLQSALIRLRLYSGPTDGLIGPSTIKSLDAYFAGFGTPPGDFLDGYAVAALERNAQDGFRSEGERELARSMGFSDALTYIEASKGGFPSADVFAEAKRRGFRSQQEYQEATIGGFKDRGELVEGQSAGFVSASEFRSARGFGLGTKAEYTAFKASGFPDGNAYRAARDRGFSDKASFDQFMTRELKNAQLKASTLLDDAQVFLRLNPAVPNLIEIADHAAGLNATLPNGSVDALAQSSSKLLSLLTSVPGYADFAAARDKERADALAKSKTATKRELQATRDVLTKWVAENISSPKLPEVIGELRLLTEAIPSDDMDKLTATKQAIDAMINRQNLSADLERLAATEGPASPEDRSVGDATVAPFAVTPANEALLRGPLNDVVVLYNAGRTAPSLTRTLTGDFSFTNDVASVCLFGVEGSPSLEHALRVALQPFGASGLDLAAEECNPGSLGDSDLLLMRRKNFVESDPSLAVAFLDAMQANTLRAFGPVTYGQLEAAQKEDDVLSAAVAAGVELKTRSGYGAIRLEVASGALCAVFEEEGAVHTQFVNEVASYVGVDLIRMPPQVGSVDDTYQSIQRGKCAVVYGPEDALGKVAEALKRDAVPVAFLPFWFDDASVKAASERLAAAKQADLKRVEAERLAARERQEAAARLQKQEQERNSAKQMVLRKEFGAPASALMNLISARLKPTVLGETSSTTVPTDAAAAVQRLFPSFAQWNASLSDDDWEATTLDATISDYGVVKWKGRSLEAIVVQAVVKLKSPERGEYKDECFVDGEFDMMRDPVEAHCDETALLSTWKTGHELTSRWQVN